LAAHLRSPSGSGFSFCDKVLPRCRSRSSRRRPGDYFDGIAPNCAAADDVEHDLGAADEASLAEAFRYIRTGQCSPTTATPESRTLRARAAPGRAYGFHSLVNAY
jgi:hypothetical protein